MHKHVAAISSVEVLSSSNCCRRPLSSNAMEQWCIVRMHKSTEVRCTFLQALKSRKLRDVPSKQCS